MINLKLDTNAINTLFPEGTQARVDLQQAVIQNFANRIIKGQCGLELTAYLTKNIQPLVEEEAKKFMSQYVSQQKNWSRNNVINTDFAKLLSKSLDSDVEVIINKAKQDATNLIKEQLADILTEIPSKIDNYVEHAVYQRGRKDAIDAINAAVTFNK